LKKENPLQGPLKGVGYENQVFLGPNIATSETHVHKITTVPLGCLDPMILKGENPLLRPVEGVDPFNGFYRIKMLCLAP
jgi:hypothetical protein